LERAERAALPAQTEVQADQILFLVQLRLLAVAVVHPVVIQTSRVILEALVAAVAAVALVLETLPGLGLAGKVTTAALVLEAHLVMAAVGVAAQAQLVLTERVVLAVMVVTALHRQLQVLL
jgi:hypothetical protein